MSENFSKYDLLAAEKIIKIIINCAYRVRHELYSGYLESVYSKALIYELQQEGLEVKAEVPLPVYYKDVVVGEFFADIIVDDKVILELKAVKQLVQSHELQLVNYLTATKIDNGLLINFGADKLEVKRKYRNYKPSEIKQ